MAGTPSCPGGRTLWLERAVSCFDFAVQHLTHRPVRTIFRRAARIRHRRTENGPVLSGSDRRYVSGGSRRAEVLPARTAALSLACLLWLYLPKHSSAASTSLAPLLHPNHYIVLVDASGSTVETRARAEVYQRALRRVLIPRLLGAGFGSLPPYDPRLDRLTVLHFGIVQSNAHNPYEHLRSADLVKGFLHPVLVRATDVSAAQLQSLLIPKSHYNLTLLFWAKPVALWASRPTDASAVAQRTFLVMVTDGVPNESTLAEECDQVRRWARPADITRISEIRSTVDRDYRFTNGSGEPGCAWQQQLLSGAGGTPVFVEAYEVVSAARLDWQRSPEAQTPLIRANIRWTGLGLSPPARLVAEPAPAFLSWLKSSKRIDASIGLRIGTVQTQTAWEPGQVLQTPTIATGVAGAADGEALLRMLIAQQDPLLGTRTVRYEYTQAIQTPSLPAHWLLVFLATASVLGPIGWWGYHRFGARHFAVDDVPGLLSGMRMRLPLRRRHAYSWRSAAAPTAGTRCFTLALPSPLMQWLFHRGTQVVIESNGAAMTWGDGSQDVTALTLPVRRCHCTAVWREQAKQPTQVHLSLRRGKGELHVTIDHPVRPKANDRNSEAGKYDYYVALDLGSDTMAAYCRPYRAGQPGQMIQLQAYASTLVENTYGEPSLVREGEKGTASCRLRTRFALMEGRQPSSLPEKHAALEFLDVNGTPTKRPEYDTCLLRYFFGVREQLLANPHLVPNPKVIFQVGSLPDSLRVQAVAGGAGTFVQLTSEQLIQHMTSHVVRNFVLKSPQLRNVSPGKVHLTVTVPDVYSLTHAQSLRNFLTTHLPVGKVEVIFESDAIAYYALNYGNQDGNLQTWRRQLQLIGARPYRILTVDIGRGTTDLSLIQIAPPPSPPSGRQSGRVQHTVLARTGRSDGGNRLSYLLAGYYEKQVQRVYEEHGRLLTPNLDSPPFGFLRLAEGARSPSLAQAEAIGHLETVIENVKSCLAAGCQLELTADQQTNLLRPLADALVRDTLRLDASAGLGEAGDRFVNLLIEALRLPIVEPWVRRLWRGAGRWRKARLGRRAVSFVSSAVHSILEGKGVQSIWRIRQRDGASPTRQELADLWNEIERYLDDTVGLLAELDAMALAWERQHQEGTATGTTSAISPHSTLVVIAGQASQFPPLRKRLREGLGQKKIPDETHVGWLQGPRAKEACCMGAVSFWLSEFEMQNPKELHGTYGMWVDTGSPQFAWADMAGVNSGETTDITPSADAGCVFVYTPRIFANPRQVVDPEDGTIACLRRFGGGQHRIRYEQRVAQLLVDDEPVALANWGELGALWPKLWPERLEP